MSAKTGQGLTEAFAHVCRNLDYMVLKEIQSTTDNRISSQLYKSSRNSVELRNIATTSCESSGRLGWINRNEMY